MDTSHFLTGSTSMNIVAHRRQEHETKGSPSSFKEEEISRTLPDGPTHVQEQPVVINRGDKDITKTPELDNPVRTYDFRPDILPVDHRYNRNVTGRSTSMETIRSRQASEPIVFNQGLYHGKKRIAKTLWAIMIILTALAIHSSFKFAIFNLAYLSNIQIMVLQILYFVIAACLLYYLT